MANPIQPNDSIYRAMEEDRGMPKLGSSATTLGVRKGKDILTDAANQVIRPSFSPCQPNGVSCSPDIGSLPAFALPVAWGGMNKKTMVWCLNPDDLVSDLIAKEDTMPGRRRHVSIGPSRAMTFDELVLAVESTAPLWMLIGPAGA